jgi:hypothetical protein
MSPPDKQSLCPYRHTVGSSSHPWVLGENEVAEVILLRNGQRQVKLRCRNCGTATGALPKQAVFEWMSDLGPPLIREGYMGSYPPCSYRGCSAPGVDMHHFAPWNTFGRDADNWPVMPLCQSHHRAWHQQMDGYHWHRKAAS